ncbi:MAG: helix-turn-helix transcriptional regulator [Lentisphaeria bacterium]|nr:helix-turn-helix transcriptional regulator [Lentisphaeria bacterium]
MKGTAVFKKRIKECTSWREEVYFNMSFQKTSLNLFQLYHIASIHCRKGKKISFSLMGGRYWSFCITTAEKSSLSMKNGRKESLSSCDLLIRPPTSHPENKVRIMGHHILESTEQKECKRYYLSIERNIYMEQMFQLGGMKIVHLKDSSKVIECIEELLVLVQNKESSTPEEISCLLYRLLTYITSKETTQPDFANPPYSHLIDIVRHNPQDYPTLESMEKTFQVSRETLRKIFLEKTSMSPMDFVIDARLNNSCWMLKYSVMPIREIAELNGYKDAAFYSHAFKKHYGISPKQYRNQPEEKK